MNQQTWMERIDAECWASLTEEQQTEYREEFHHLHARLGLTVAQAKGVIGRCVRIAAWK